MCGSPPKPRGEAVLQALYDFHTTAEHILTKAIAAAQREFHDAHADRHAEHDALTAQVTTNQAKIDRYRAAFENGTMDDETAGPRIKQLRREIEQLTARRDDLSDSLDNQPEPPPAGTIERLRAHLAHTITDGISGDRKRAIEALVHEIRITDEGVIRWWAGRVAARTAPADRW